MASYELRTLVLLLRRFKKSVLIFLVAVAESNTNSITRRAATFFIFVFNNSFFRMEALIEVIMKY